MKSFAEHADKVDILAPARYSSDGNGLVWGFHRDDMRDVVFYADKRGFQPRLNLVGDRGLHGFCPWVLGTEDREIWTLLAAHK